MDETPMRLLSNRIRKGQPQGIKGSIDPHLINLSELSPTEIENDRILVGTPDSIGLHYSFTANL
jgi:hypothetical protein